MYSIADFFAWLDGLDEVHRGVIARLELARYGKRKWSPFEQDNGGPLTTQQRAQLKQA